MRILALLLLFLPITTLASPANWLILTTDGRDAEGGSLFDRFEITPDGLAKWQASSIALTDSSCAESAGRLQGKADPETSLKIIELAEKALSEQPAMEEDERGTSIRILLSSDGKTRSGNIQKSSSSWKSFLLEIARLKRNLDPHSMVQMKARRKGNLIHVTFSPVAGHPVSIQLPEDANEAFRMKKFTLAYAKKPAAYETKVEKDLSITLKVSGKFPETGELHYSNSVILHHGNETDLTPRQELSLCAKF